MDNQQADIVNGIWAAFNYEKMSADAWANCFQRLPDLNSDEYRKIIFIVLLLYIERPNDCTPTVVQNIISRRDLLDPKTVATRIRRLIDCKLFEVAPHSSDKRKRLIRPTAKLIEPLKRYSAMTLGIAKEITNQASTAGIAHPIVNPQLRFNLLEYLDRFTLQHSGLESGLLATKRE
jgi:DNA-binding MarR family transcriptional regulator